MTIVRLKPRSNAAWHRYRSQDITASVVGALFGVDNWCTYGKLWHVKAGLLPPDTIDTPAMMRGRILEEPAIKVMRLMHPEWEITHNTDPGNYWRDTEARLGATPDALVVDPVRGPGIVQIKSVHPLDFKRLWHDEDGVCEPPFWIALQATVEAHLTGSKWASIGALVVDRGLDLHLIDVPLDNMDGVITRIKAEISDFWKSIENGQVPPLDYSRDAEFIDRLYAVDQGEEIDLSRDNAIYDLIANRHRLKEAAKACHQQVAAIDAEIKHKLQGATIGHLPGGRKITWKAQRRAGFYTPPASFRVLRVPQPEEQSPP